MITLLNTDKARRKAHFILDDCIRANTGGSVSPWLRAASKIPGWTHNFCGWVDCRSVEALEADNEETLTKLEKIYDLSLDEVKNMT